jgi:hypothetical protein
MASASVASLTVLRSSCHSDACLSVCVGTCALPAPSPRVTGLAKPPIL